MTPTPERPNVKYCREVAAFPEGEAAIYWPSPLSVDSTLELETWLHMLTEKLKRRHAEPAPIEEPR